MKGSFQVVLRLCFFASYWLLGTCRNDSLTSLVPSPTATLAASANSGLFTTAVIDGLTGTTNVTVTSSFTTTSPSVRATSVLSTAAQQPTTQIGLATPVPTRPTPQPTPTMPIGTMRTNPIKSSGVVALLSRLAIVTQMVAIVVGLCM